MTNLRHHTIQLHVSFICNDTQLVVNEELLDEIFSSYGTVLDCVIKQYPLIPEASKQCGYGFVFYEDMTAVENAVASTKDVLIRNIHFGCTLSHDSHNRLNVPNPSSSLSLQHTLSGYSQASSVDPSSSSLNPHETNFDSSRTSSKVGQTKAKVQAASSMQAMTIAPTLAQLPTSSPSPLPNFSFHPVVPSDTMTVSNGIYSASTQGYGSLRLPPPISTTPRTAGQALSTQFEQGAPPATVPGIHSMMLPSVGAMMSSVPTRVDEYALYSQLQAPMQAIPGQHFAATAGAGGNVNTAYTAIYAVHAPAPGTYSVSAPPTTSGPASASSHFAPGFYHLSHPSQNIALNSPFNYNQNSPQGNHPQMYLQQSNSSASSSMASGFHPSYYFHHTGQTPLSSSSGCTSSSLAAFSVAATLAPSPLHAHQFSQPSHQHSTNGHPIQQLQHLPVSASSSSSSSPNPHPTPYHSQPHTLPLSYPHHGNSYIFSPNSNPSAPSSTHTEATYQSSSHPSHTSNLPATFPNVPGTVPNQPGSHHLQMSATSLNSNDLSHNMQY